jgi:hypothetical protein
MGLLTIEVCFAANDMPAQVTLHGYVLDSARVHQRLA